MYEQIADFTKKYGTVLAAAGIGVAFGYWLGKPSDDDNKTSHPQLEEGKKKKKKKDKKEDK